MFFWLWIIVLVGSVVFEIASATSLISIWFAVGALFALVANQINLNFGIQVIFFITTSILSIILLRPFVYKYVRENRIPTNADRLIGIQTRLLKGIDLDCLGEVRVNGITWNAISINQQSIEAGAIVEIKAIDGTKLVVVRVA